MAAGTVTPTEAGQGPGVLNIAANIGAKIRDAASEAKEEREKANEKGMKPKKGSLFSSALRNKFNPIKSKKDKAKWSRQFDWNKKSSDTAKEVKTPSETGGEKGKAKLKEFIAGGFTAIIKDTTAMRAKMDGIRALTSANLEQATRTTGSLTMIKESVDAQTEIRRKALEQAKFAKSERRLEKTKDVAGLSGTKGPGGSAEQQPGQQPDSDDGGGGWMSWLTNALGIGDLAANFMPKGGLKPILSKLNPMNWFKKAPTTKGGIPITSSATRATNTGARVTTTAGKELAEEGGKQALKKFFTGIPVKAAALSFAIDMAMGESIDRALAGLAGNAAGAAYGAALFAPVPVPGARVVGAILGGILGEETMKRIATFLTKVGRFKFDNFVAAENARREAIKAGAAEKNLTPGDVEALVSGSRIKDVGGGGTFNNLPDMYNDPLGLRTGPMAGLSQGGVITKLAPGGLVDNPTRTTLYPGDRVIPLNRQAGKDMLSEGAGDLPMKAQAAMMLGVSTAFLSGGMGGAAADSVKQDIRKASKGVDIANLTLTSSLGGGQFRPVNPDQAAENFMEKLFKNVSLLGINFTGGGGGGGGNNGGNQNLPPGANLANTAVIGEVDLAANTHQHVGFTPNQQFGDRGGTHMGSDIGTQGEKGYYVGFKKSGTVVNKGYQARGAGHWVGIDVGGGVEYRFMHLAQASDLNIGDAYSGQTIGEIGNTGNSFGEHLHFEKLVNGQYVDPKEDAKVLLDIGRGLNRQFRANNVKVATAPTTEDPGTAEQPTVTQEASDGMWGPSWLPWNWGKVADQGRKGATLGGNAFGYEAKYGHVTDPEQRRMLGLPPLQQSKGGSTPINKIRVKTTGRNKTKSYQRWDGTQWLTGTGADAQKYKSMYAAQKSAGASLGVKAPPPKNPPERQRPTPPPQQSNKPPVVVTPPIKSSPTKSASATGSFGSSIPAARTAAANFADFLYPDLV